jgi:lipooligosaccharide transport system permease protein
MFFTGLTPSIDMFNLPIFLFITPMFLFSGTFFPIDTLPIWAQKFALFLPLTHLVHASRSLCLGIMSENLPWAVAYMIALIIIFFPLAVITMHRRLIH